MIIKSEIKKVNNLLTNILTNVITELNDLISLLKKLGSSWRPQVESQNPGGNSDFIWK